MRADIQSSLMSRCVAADCQAADDTPALLVEELRNPPCNFSSVGSRFTRSDNGDRTLWIWSKSALNKQDKWVIFCLSQQLRILRINRRDYANLKTFSLLNLLGCILQCDLPITIGLEHAR